MTDYAPDSVQIGGTTANIRSAASGDKLTLSGDHSILRVNNGSGAPITLTITPPGTTAYGVANPAKVVTITNGTAKYIPIPSTLADPSDAGKVALAWSATATITFEYTRS